MAVDQTTVQNQKSVISGSVAMYYSTNSGSSFTNLGVGDGFTFTENVTKLDQTPDNGPTPDKLEGISLQTVNISGNLWEYDLAKLNALRGGIDLYTSTATGTVSGATQTIASGNWEYEGFIELEGQNADGTEPTINSVTLGTDGAIVEDTDYFTVKVNGKWGIQIIDSATVTTEAQAVVVDYDYTPSTTEELSTGGLSLQNRVWIRLVNRTPDTADASDAATAGITLGDSIWRTTRYDFYYTTLDGGINVTFPAENGTETVIKLPVSFLGKNDPSRTDGDKLMKISRFIEARS